MSFRLCWQGWGVQLQVSGPAHLLDEVKRQVPVGGRLVEGEPDIRFDWDPARQLWIRTPGDEPFLELDEALQMEVATGSPTHLFIHAGAVCYRGRALVLPGLSRSGKSTLVEALARRGAVYYSDEFAVFQEDGKVMPYPRWLSLRAGAGRVESVQIDPGQLGWRPDFEAVPLGWMLDCRYSGRHHLQPISAGEALLSLFSNAVAARTRAKALFRGLSKALAGVSSYRGVRCEADSAADWIMEWLSA